MPRQFDTVRRAPFQTGFCKILRKQFVHDVDIVGGGAVEIFALFPPIQLGNHKFPAEFFVKDFFKPRRIRRHARAVCVRDPETVKQRAAVRFVRENALYHRAEQIFAMPRVLLVRALQKQRGHFPVHRVDIGIAVIKIFARLFLFREHRITVSRFYLRGGSNAIAIDKPVFALTVLFAFYRVTAENAAHFGLRKRLFVGIVKRKKPKAVFSLLRHCAAAGARRPTVLVVKPNFHARRRGFFGASAHQIEPFRTEVFGFQPRARMDKKAAEAHFAHDVDLGKQFVFLEFAVPRPKGLAAVLRSRVLYHCKKLVFFHRVFPYIKIE